MKYLTASIVCFAIAGWAVVEIINEIKMCF
jgi:hypothetical protein